MRTSYKPHNKALFAGNGLILIKNNNAVMGLVDGSPRVNHKTAIYCVMFSYNMSNYC